jgi:hypothetical protein
MTCKGICIRHKVSGRYVNGHKRCQPCTIFIKWEGILFPCCGYKLRTRPRVSKYKEKLREQKRIERVKEVLRIFPNVY